MKNRNILKLANSLSRLNKDFIEKKCRIIDKNIYNNEFLFFHYFFWSSEFYNNPYRNLLIDYFDKAERAYPGSSLDTSVKICNLIYNKINTEEKKSKTDKSIESIWKYISTKVPKETFNLFKDILEFSGADATITCLKSKNNEIEVEKICDPKFSINIESSFSDIYFKNIEKTTKEVAISIVDGYIERESEIYSLLEYSKLNSLPIVLICRGMSDYAKQNLKQILLKNNIFIYPYIEKHNNEDPFKLKDLASLIDAKIVSSEYSDSIQKSLIEKIKIVKCRLEKGAITFFCKSDNLIAEINKQISENHGNHELVKYLQKRKTRCSPNNTIVKIPETKSTLLNEIKNLIKCYNYCVLHGVYESESGRLNSVKSKNISNILSKNFYKNIENINYKIKVGENNAGSKK